MPLGSEHTPSWPEEQEQLVGLPQDSRSRNLYSTDAGAIEHGTIPYKDRVRPYSTILRRTRWRTAVKLSFFTVLDGARLSLWLSGCNRRIGGVEHAYHRAKIDTICRAHAWNAFYGCPVSCLTYIV